MSVSGEGNKYLRSTQSLSSNIREKSKDYKTSNVQFKKEQLLRGKLWSGCKKSSPLSNPRLCTSEFTTGAAPSHLLLLNDAIGAFGHFTCKTAEKKEQSTHKKCWEKYSGSPGTEDPVRWDCSAVSGQTKRKSRSCKQWQGQETIQRFVCWSLYCLVI